MKRKVILVEGPDNVGKTTLIQGIQNKLNDIQFHVLHYSNVKQESKEKSILYNKTIYKQMFELFNSDLSFICDRSHLGEMVYGPIYRNYSGEYVLDLEANSGLCDEIYLVTLIDTSDNLITRDDGLSFSTESIIKNQEIRNFVNAHEKSNIKNKLIINVDSHGIDEVLEKVCKELLNV